MLSSRLAIVAISLLFTAGAADADSVRSSAQSEHASSAPIKEPAEAETLLASFDRPGRSGVQVYYQSSFEDAEHSRLRIETRVINTDSSGAPLLFQCFTAGAWHSIGVINSFHSTNYNEADNVLSGDATISYYTHPTGVDGRYLCGFGGDSSYYGYHTGQSAGGGSEARYGVVRSQSEWTHFRIMANPSAGSNKTIVNIYGL